MDGRPRGIEPGNVANARELRRTMTPAEAVLWRALRDRRLAGLKFRRQHPVGPLVLDFCCPILRLAVEVDGAVHDAKTDQDSARTELLEANGYQVLRFRNDEVLTSLPSVLARIHHAASVLAQKGCAFFTNARGGLAPLSCGRAGYPLGGGWG